MCSSARKQAAVHVCVLRRLSVIVGVDGFTGVKSQHRL